MISCTRIDKNNGQLVVKGTWLDCMAEYKMITDYFLANHFEAFIKEMDSWKAGIEND